MRMVAARSNVQQTDQLIGFIMTDQPGWYAELSPSLLTVPEALTRSWHND